MSILQKIGFALIGQDALAAIKKDVVVLTTATVQAEEALKRSQVLAQVGEQSRRPSIAIQVALVSLVGSEFAETLKKAAVDAEATGEGFMKKKAAVHKLAKTLGLSKSVTNLVVELAVQAGVHR